MGILDATMSTAVGVAVFAFVVATVGSVLTGLFPNAILIATAVGIGFGSAAMTGTYIGLDADPGSREYQIAFASGAFGVTFLGVGIVAFGTGWTVGMALLAGAAAGLLAAVGVVVAGR